MCLLAFRKVMIMMKNKILRLSLLLLLVISLAKPNHIFADTRLGAAPLKFTKNNVDYEYVSFDQLFFHYEPPIDIEHPDGNVTKGTKKPMPIPKEIKVLNGKKVAIKGFVIPLPIIGRKIKRF